METQGRLESFEDAREFVSSFLKDLEREEIREQELKLKPKGLVYSDIQQIERIIKKANREQLYFILTGVKIKIEEIEKDL